MKTVWLLFLCFFLSVASGQENFKSGNREAQRNFEQANQLISLKQFETAIEKLEIAIRVDKTFIAAYQQLGDLYRKLEQYQSAKKNYSTVLQLVPDFHPLTIFGLAESEFYLGNYLAALNLFKKHSTIPNLSVNSKKATEKFIRDCEFSIEAIKTPVLFSPKNLGIDVNSGNDEYLPAITADEETLIFTRRTNNKEDFYQTKKQNGQWTTAKYLSGNVNTETFNEGSQCISPDGLYLFFTGCNRPDGLGRCDIYLCRREGSKNWSKPFNLGPPVNTPGWESQPSISADGKTLYFVSSRQGGLGGNDIWKTTLQDGGAWSTPVNLGPQINTAYDEHSPFIHPDGQTLYFASNGWPGFGKNDLFISRKDETGNWQKASNMGFPVNNAGEQSGLTVSTDGKTAYFASNITGGYGKMDLYSFELPEVIRPHIVTYVKGSVFDAQTKEFLDATVRISELKHNTSIYEDVSDETGQFLATLPAGYKYGLTVERPGYLFHSENFVLEKPSEIKPFELNIALQKISVGKLTVLNNVLFESNKAELLNESKFELNQLIAFLNSNPNIAIEITGHTDNIGDDKNNQLLSENRAKAVLQYLVSNKISPTRLNFKGMGESSPVADNLSEEGRRKNRRTEIKVTRL